MATSCDGVVYLDSMMEATVVRVGEVFDFRGQKFRVCKGSFWSPSECCLMCQAGSACTPKACAAEYRADCKDVYFEKV